MAFSDGFRTGYAIGDAAKKRRATAKFFEKFQELTADDDAEEVTSIGGIDVPTPADPAIPAPAAGADGRLPVPDLPAVESSPIGGSALEAPEAEGAIPVKAPKKIPLKSANEVRTSLTQANIKELDKLALEAARASGDVEVYGALQKTTDSFLQARVLKNMSLAQTAATNGDVDSAEKYLTKAYRYVPDGQEIKFKRKDGQLMIQDPWGDGEVALDGEKIGQLTTMIRDPERWAEIVRQERKDRHTMANEDKRTALLGEQVDVSRGHLGVAQGQAEEERRKNGVAELMATKEFNRNAANDKYDNLMKVAHAAYYMAEAGKNGDGSEAMKPDDMRQYGESVNKEIQNFLAPTIPADPTDPLSASRVGPAPKGYEIFAGKDGLTELGLRAKEIGGGLGIANPQLGPAAAARAGLEVTRALVTKQGSIRVSPKNGTITVMINGAPTTLRAPDQVMQALIEASQAQKPKAP